MEVSNMPIESLAEILKTLTYHQGIVLYWTCKDLKYEDIAERYGYKKSWCVWQMSFVYHKLGLDQKDPRTGQSLHWNQRREIIIGEVCPAFMRLINDDPKNIEPFPLIAEGVVVEPQSEIPIPPPEPTPEPPQLPPGPLPDPTKPPPEGFYPVELYKAWLMVLEDEKPIGDPPPPPPPQPDWRRILILASLLGCIGCLAVAVFAYRAGQENIPTSTPFLAAATQEILATETLMETPTQTLTSISTDTLTPTSTLTPTVTFTLIPTETKSPLGLGKGDELRDDRVTLKLIDVKYNEKYDRIGAKFAPVSYYFDFTNHSGETIVLQVDTTDFKITDNTGAEANCWFYHISGAGTAINEPLNNGDTRQIVARCGLGMLNPEVNTFTLTVFPFSSLPESTWVVQVPH